MKAAFLALLLVAWVSAVVFCTLCRQWYLVVALFTIAWFGEQVVTYGHKED